MGKKEGWNIIGNPGAKDIMGCYCPKMLPILSTLAKEYAVSDAWFGSAPTETLPNRAFLHMATSQGILDDHTKIYTSKSIFKSLDEAEKSWQAFGYETDPLMRHLVADITHSPNCHFCDFSDFKDAASQGSLANHVFLEPSWGTKGNSQHPNYDVARGEQFLAEIYETLRKSPCWEKTLLVITYDEHGGCYDHTPPPANAANPEAASGQDKFNFQRFGPRVPTVLVSPLIKAGTVLRADGETPFDHTSILKTIENRFGLTPLTARDKAAPCVGNVLTLKTPRTDNVLQGICPPESSDSSMLTDDPSHLQEVMAAQVAKLPIPESNGHGIHHKAPKFENSQHINEYINKRSNYFFNK